MGLAETLLQWDSSRDPFNFQLYHYQSASFFSQAKQRELFVRRENLVSIATALDLTGIKYWLQGKTLLGFTAWGGFIPDHDDDLAIAASDLEPLCNKTIPLLISQGFNLIRVTNDDTMISLERNYRYIDICIFRKTPDSAFHGYGKYYPTLYYSHSVACPASFGFNFSLPWGALEICNLKYTSLCKYRLNTYIIWEHGLTTNLDLAARLDVARDKLTVVEKTNVSILRNHLRTFLELLYCKEKHASHIHSKCHLLLQASESCTHELYKLQVVKVAYTDHSYQPSQAGTFDQASRTLFETIKWDIREAFNPRFSGEYRGMKLPITSPGVSHCHVIHGTDTIAELVLIDLLISKYGQELNRSRYTYHLLQPSSR